MRHRARPAPHLPSKVPLSDAAFRRMASGARLPPGVLLPCALSWNPVKLLTLLFDRDRRPPRLTLAYYALAGITFLLAAVYRFHWPAEPFFDADGWGYLWGGLRKLTGGNYEHKWGREYLYPGMI